MISPNNNTSSSMKQIIPCPPPMDPENFMEAKLKPSPTPADSSSNSSNLMAQSLKDNAEYQGFHYQSTILEFVKAAQDEFQAQPGDVLLATCPKSGTTWLKALAFAIITRHHYGTGEDKPSSPHLYTFPHHRVPYLEHPFARCVEQVEGFSPSRRLIATHIPYTSLPRSVLSHDGCKVVYLCREPKDMLVSGWHFWCKIVNKSTPFDEFFVDFCEGKIMFGPCWDHILGYWKASRENTNSVMFLKYEDLKKDTIGIVKKLAEFMGCPFSSIEEEPGRVEEVVKLCSFESLSNLEVNKQGKYETLEADVFLENKVLFMKGEVGGWKQLLTPEMKETLDCIIREKFSGYDGLSFSLDN